MAAIFGQWWILEGHKIDYKNECALAAWDAAIKSKEADELSHNKPKAKISSNTIESDNLCAYCVETPASDRCNSCNSKQMYDNFIGRKLSAIC